MTVRSVAEEIRQQKPFASIRQEAVLTLMRTDAVLLHLIEARLKTVGLTQQQYNVLRILRGAGEPLPTMEIGERLVQPTPGITRLIARLERDGFVERQPNPADARSVLVALTPSGRARLTKADPIVASVDDELGQGLSDKELSTLVKLLNKLRSRFG